MYLNERAGANGVGRLDIVENRFVGIKSRGCYETPAGTVLREAHLDLEGITLDREVVRIRDRLSAEFATLAYNGFWFAPEMELVRHSLDFVQRHVNGAVEIELYKGNVIIKGRESPNALYSADLASMDIDDVSLRFTRAQDSPPPPTPPPSPPPTPPPPHPTPHTPHPPPKVHQHWMPLPYRQPRLRHQHSTRRRRQGKDRDRPPLLCQLVRQGSAAAHLDHDCEYWGAPRPNLQAVARAPVGHGEAQGRVRARAHPRRLHQGRQDQGPHPSTRRANRAGIFIYNFIFKYMSAVSLKIRLPF